MQSAIGQRWAVLRQSPAGLIGAGIILAYLFMAVLGPVFVHLGVSQNLSQAYEPPSWSHWLGTECKRVTNHVSALANGRLRK